MMSDTVEDDLTQTAERLVSDRIGTYTGSPLGNLTIVEDQTTLVKDLSVESEGSGSDGSNVNPDISTGASRDVSNISVEGVKNEPTGAEYSDQVEAVGGSEETFSKPCQPCLENDKHTDSMLYCLECEDYLCERCVEMHRGVKLTKRHTLLPKEVPDTQRDQFRMIKKEYCHIHVHECVEWFCASDDKLCCQICKATEHRQCEAVIALTSVAKTVELQTIEQKILEAQNELKATIERKQVDITNLEEDRMDSLRVLDNIKTDTENTFKMLVCTLEKENRKIDAKFTKQHENIKSDIENYSKIAKSLGTTLTVLQKKNTCDEYKFIQMKKAEQQLKAVQKTIPRDTSEPLSTPIGYERDKLYDQKLNAFDRFGYFDDEKSIYKCSTPRRINVAQRNETHAFVFDICVVGCDQILITDWRNSAIKLVDTNKGTVKSSLDVQTKPFGVCKLEEDEMYAITLTHDKRVLFIRVKKFGSMINKSSFETGECCRGIAVCNSRLFVACGGREKEGPGHIRIFDLDGNLFETFMTDKSGKAILSYPWKLERLPGTNKLLITDRKQLMQIDAQDKVIQLVTDIQICSSWSSVSFDSENRIVICDFVSSSINLFSSDRRLVQKMVIDLPSKPIAIAVDNSNLKMFVALEKSDDLFCFQLETNCWEKPPTFR